MVAAAVSVYDMLQLVYRLLFAALTECRQTPEVRTVSVLRTPFDPRPGLVESREQLRGPVRRDADADSHDAIQQPSAGR